MKNLLLYVCFFLPCVSTLGCSGGQPTVVVDERSEEVIQAEFDDYDKQMAEDAKSYEQQQGGN